MGVKRVKERILSVLNSYSFSILLAVLIAVECLDLVAEVLVEHKISEMMVEDNLRIMKFVETLKVESEALGSRISIDHFIIVSSNILNVYDVRDVTVPCNNFTQTSLTQQTGFTLNFTHEKLGAYCGVPGNTGHLDLTSLSHRSDISLQNIGHGIRIFGLVNITFMACETLVRIICTGRAFGKRKIDIFDAFVVFTSLILDYTFYSKEFTTSSIVILLLLPWRIIRIVNSLILAIHAKHTLQMKTLKQEKRNLEEKTGSLSDELKDLKDFIEKLEELCKMKGATELDIKMCRNHKRAPMTLAAISTLASMMLMGTPFSRNKRPSMISETKSSVVNENNNLVKASKDGKLVPPFISNDGRRSISTPNLMRNLSAPNSTMPFPQFYSPLYILTPVHSPVHQPMFFPDNMDIEAARQSLSGLSMHDGMARQSLSGLSMHGGMADPLFHRDREVPNIQVTSPI